MSPVGGVGINYAIFDAVVASNVLGARLRAGLPIATRELAEVQHRRELPTRAIQLFQTLAQNVVMRRLKNGSAAAPSRHRASSTCSFSRPGFWRFRPGSSVLDSARRASRRIA